MRRTFFAELETVAPACQACVPLARRTGPCRKFLWVSGVKSVTALRSEPEGTRAVTDTSHGEILCDNCQNPRDSDTEATEHQTLSSQKAALWTHGGSSFEILQSCLWGLGLILGLPLWLPTAGNMSFGSLASESVTLEVMLSHMVRLNLYDTEEYLQRRTSVSG